MKASVRAAVIIPAALAGAVAAALPAVAQGFWSPWQSTPAQQPPPPRQQFAPRQHPIFRHPRPVAHKRPSQPVARHQPAAPQPGAPQEAAKAGAASAAPGQPSAPDHAGLEGPPPPYEPQLLRLAEILGALSYLRDICSAHDGDAWRGKMTALLDAEAKTQARRERLAGAFNRGFRGYEVIYRTCTPNADTAIARYVAEGGKIARDINYRYGGS